MFAFLILVHIYFSFHVQVSQVIQGGVLTADFQINHFLLLNV